MSKTTIWAALKNLGFSDNGAAAMMGNMEAESNCVSCRMQGDFTACFENSRTYAKAVDNGTITEEDFVQRGPNGGGWGLCQWTYCTRKRGLYRLAKETGRSIGDEAVQIEWLWHELNLAEYSQTKRAVLSGDSLREISDVIMTKFERPADQSETALAKRAAMGAQILAEMTASNSDASGGDFKGNCEQSEEQTVFWPPRILCQGMTGADVEVLQALLTAHGYDTKGVDGDFGIRTKAMLLAFQSENGLDADAIAGPLTFRSLGVSI